MTTTVGVGTVPPNESYEDLCDRTIRGRCRTRALKLVKEARRRDDGYHLLFAELVGRRSVGYAEGGAEEFFKDIFGETPAPEFINGVLKAYQEALETGLITLFEPEKMVVLTKQPVGSMSQEDMKELVFAICDGTVFTDRHLHPGGRAGDLGMVFMPIALGGLQFRDVEDLGMVYEFLHKAGPRSINGYPCFLSMNLVNRSDAERIWKAVFNEQDRRQKAQEDMKL